MTTQQKSEPTTLREDGSLKETNQDQGPGNYNSNTTPLVYTISEVAKLLKIGRSLVYTMASTGGIPTLRMGKRILIPHRALMAMMEGKEAPRC